MTETEALEKVLAGENEHYAVLFRLYSKRAFGLAFQYLRSKEDSMDLVQDAFVKAFQNLHRFDRARSFGPWLLRIVRNLAVDILRARREDSSDDVERAASNCGSQEDEVLKGELWRAFLKLDRGEREIVFLRDYLGHDYAEMAHILNIPVGTVMSRLHRARKELAAQLLGGSA